MSICNSCTACCDVPTVWKGGLLTKDLEELPSVWVPIKKRDAKRRNPHLVNFIRKHSHNRNVTFFKCRALTAEGCGIYEDRPYVCSGYPNYDGNAKTYEWHLKRYPLMGTEYTMKCTHYEIMIDNIGGMPIETETGEHDEL